MIEGRNKWDERAFRKALTKAVETIECSWGVAGILHHKAGEMGTVLIFNDECRKIITQALRRQTIEALEMAAALAENKGFDCYGLCSKEIRKLKAIVESGE